MDLGTEKKNMAMPYANMPTWRKLLHSYPHTLLNASGQYVGLPEGFIGNSEVGHLTLGAGRVVESILKRFHRAMQSLAQSPGW